MIPRVLVILVIAVGSASAEPVAAWSLALDMAATSDATRTSTGEGKVSLGGTGVGVQVSLARRVRESRWYVVSALSLRIVGDLTRATEVDRHPLPDAALLYGGIGVGLAWRSPALRWWVSAALGPTLAMYTSPRAIGLTEVGIAADVAATRSFRIGRRWSIDVIGRGTLAALPDGMQTWALGSFGVGVGARAAW